MAEDQILGVDIHDAVTGVRRAIENNRLKLNSPRTIEEFGKIRLGTSGKIDPTTVGPGVRATIRAYIGGHPDDWATR